MIELVGSALYILSAVACFAAAVWILHRGDRARSELNAAILAAVFTGIWAAIAASLGPGSPISDTAESLRNLSLIHLVFRLFANDGRDEAVRLIRPVVLALVFVELLQFGVIAIASRLGGIAEIATFIFQISAVLHLLVAIGALVLLHNLYLGAALETRQLLRWSGLALAALWVFDLNLYTVGYLSAEPPELLYAVRGAVAAVSAVLLAMGCNATTAGLQFRPSRAAAFRGLSLMLIGGYMLAMVVVTQSLSALGGDLARLTQVGFLVIGTVIAIVWLPSAKARAWLRVTLSKHLFQHRYDYRAEWLRFTETIGRGGLTGTSLQERAVQAMADITDSPSGLLLAPNEEAELDLVAQWQWDNISVPSPAADYRMAGEFERSEFVLDLDSLRAGKSKQNAISHLPRWLAELDNAWAVVPLLHFERLVGVVVLSRPSVARLLDWEDFDLLRAAGRQLASYLAEQSGQQALMEAGRFDEFNRRIAFVMHDIKNLASQLTLLARNAEKHADNPEFRADMLITLRNSADKLNTLLARLGRYGPGKVDADKTFDLAMVAEDLATKFSSLHPVKTTQPDPCLVVGDPDALEQALQHLIQNAIDASSEADPVYLDVSRDGLRGRIEVVDSGVGMPLDFVRNGLFKPFISSKDGGFGIGAFEARALIRAMGGRLNVESREGLGTRFIASLPAASASELMAQSQSSKSEVA